MTATEIVYGPLLDFGRFRTYVQELPDDEHAGRTGNPFTCPLATYLSECLGLTDVYVGPNYYSWITHPVGEMKEQELCDLPLWARKLVERVDTGNRRDIPVRPAWLRHLVQVIEEEGYTS